MGLPGITKDQMIEVDRMMIEEYSIPLIIMMERAGLNLAKLAVVEMKQKFKQFLIIAGTGNNAGGGFTAGRDLASWGYDTEIYLPKGKEKLKRIPLIQLKRAENAGAKINEGLPKQSIDFENTLLIDSYLGYNFSPRPDEITDRVFEFLASKNNILSLDVPSGLDINTGKSYSGIIPRITLTLAFTKKGLLLADKKHIGKLFVGDIGVPISIFREILKDFWRKPFQMETLQNLYLNFSINSLQAVSIVKNRHPNKFFWDISKIK